MPLPLFALLALAGTGGAVTGYAGEVQRKKLKAARLHSSRQVFDILGKKLNAQDGKETCE